jgi:lysophospholipase L1-like esterase
MLPAPVGVTTPTERINILFIGNSLTYSNDLPALVQQIARDHGVKIKTEVLAHANYALEDHWNDGVIQKRIASEKFQYVIVQQGPSSQADGKAMLLDYGQRIKTLCDKHKSQLTFFMVWPARANASMFDGVINNYTEAATKTGSLLCPVGKIWKEHFEKTNDYSYYGPDNFHPSVAGSKVAAEVIFETLTSP